MPLDYLLIGGGLASANAAETLRAEGADGTIAIVGAVVGIGVTPEAGFLEGSGIEVDGVRVNARLRANVPDVFAASDVFNGHRRVEHADNAMRQGRIAVVRESSAGIPASQDLDFSRASIAAHIRAGHAAAMDALAKVSARRHRATAARKEHPR